MPASLLPRFRSPGWLSRSLPALLFLAPAAPCQAAQCHPSLGCLLVAVPDGTICNDGNACTASDLCVAGTCKAGSAADCSDGDPCTSDSCDGAKGCTHGPAADGTACNDGDPCTDADSCAQGKCLAGNSICGCKSNADCQDDGNLCNGVPYCDKSNPAAPKCLTNPATVIYCPGGFDTACLKNACEPSSGTCAPTPIELAVQVCTGANSCIWLKNQGGAPVPKVIPCDDGDSCTAVDECKNGSCQPGANNVCGCQNDAACAGQDDGNLCNGTLYCDKSEKPAKCKINPATVVSCPTVDDTFCQVTECNPKEGKCQKIFAHQKQSCDDQNSCTSGETCQSGQCQAAANTCVCTQDLDCAAEEDGDLCNGVLFCNKQSGVCEINPATVVSCPSADNTACQQNLCQSKTGQCAMTAVSEGGSCGDGNPCTDNDHCAKGQCVGTAACDCSKDSDCASKEDGDLCNGTLYCKSGKCEVNPASTVKCSNSFDTICLQSQCDKVAGNCKLVAVNQGVACSDGDPCSASETCQLGQCKAGSNLCECQNNQDCQAKDDGNFCNGTLYCDKAKAPFVCAVNPATVVKCPSVDDTFCAASLCQPKTGVCELSPVHQGLACDDGNPCTENDLCDAGQCAGDGQGTCDDANPCTQDLCNLSGGCSHVPLTGSCSDGNFCTLKDQCAGGFCKPGLLDSCDDSNACTDDSCLPSKGCQHLPNSSDCQSGNCTYADSCIKGACVSSGKAGFVDQWYGAAVAERPRKLAQIGQEGFWLVGDSYELSTADGYLVRTDVNGVALSKAVVKPSFANSVGADYLTGVVASSFGAMIAGGTSSCQQRGWILRVDPTGKEVWSKPYSHDNGNSCSPGANTGFFYDIADGQDGSWAAVGWRHGHPWTNDVLHAWVVRVDKDGVMLTNNLFHKGAAIFYGVAPMGGLGYAAVGATDETTAGGWDGLVSRLAANGSALWHKKLGGSGNDYLVEADAAPDGGVYAAGRSASGGAGNDDGWVVRLDVAGNLLWQRTYGGGQNDGLSGLSVLPGGGVVVAGYTYSKGKGGADLWLIGLDPAGNVQWERVQGSASDDVIQALVPLTGTGLAAAAYGTPPKAAAHDFRLLVLDSFGHFSCSEAGSCFGKALADCSDGQLCTADDCNATSGCTVSAATWPCSDGDACTEKDSCQGATCAGGGPVTCDDKNPCTKDNCDKVKGCIAEPLANGTSCGTGKTCSLGICK